MKLLAALAAIAVLAGAGAAATPAQSANEDLERRRLELDVKRLELDVGRLQREGGSGAAIQRWLPAASVLVALFGALYGVWRYFDERTLERQKRTAEGVAHHLERLVDPSTGEGSASGRAVAALGSLDAIVPRDTTRPGRIRRAAAWARVRMRSKEARRGISDAEHRAHITKSIRALVVDGLTSLHTADDARMPVTCLDWPEFHEVLMASPELVEDIADRYLVALQSVADQAATWIREARRDGARFTSTAASGRLSAENAHRLAEVVSGAERFISMLPADGSRADAIVRFSRMAPKLGAQLFAAETTVSAPPAAI